MAGWGAISAAQAATQSFGGLLACRALLGVVEAPFFPGAIMLMSSWYTRSELAHRIAWHVSLMLKYSAFTNGHVLGFTQEVQ